MPNYAHMEGILEGMVRGTGHAGRRVKRMLRNMVDHLRPLNPQLAPLDRMQMRFKKGLILWFCENAGAMNEMRSTVPKVAESVPGLSVSLVPVERRTLRKDWMVDWPADSWDSGIPVLGPEELGDDRVIRSDADPDPEEWM
jgi:hypothetical protein